MNTLARYLLLDTATITSSVTVMRWKLYDRSLFLYNTQDVPPADTVQAHEHNRFRRLS